MKCALHCCLFITTLLFVGCNRSEPPRTSSTLDTVQDAGVLRAGVRADAPPFGQRIGQEVLGFDIDLVNMIAVELGIDQVELVVLTADERLTAIESGRVDLVAGAMTITRRRDQRVDFTLPYFEDGQGLLVPTGSTITHYSQLAGRRVAVLAGSTGEKNLAQAAPSAIAVPFPTNNDSRAALIGGDVDAISTDSIILDGLRHQAGKTDLTLLPDRFSWEPYGIALPENDSDWRDAVDHALQRIWESGRYHLLYETWFGSGTAYERELDFAIAPYPR